MDPSPLPLFLAILFTPPYEFSRLYAQCFGHFTDGLRAGLSKTVLQIPVSGVGDPGKPGQLPLGEDHLFSEPFELF